MTKKLSCRTIRKMYLDSCDGEIKIAPAAEAHAANCRSCLRFRDFLAGYRDELVRGFAQVVNTQPDSRAIIVSGALDYRRKKQRMTYALTGIAAALAITAGSFMTAAITSREQEQELVRQETGYFVDDLFATPLFDGIEYLGEE